MEVPANVTKKKRPGSSFTEIELEVAKLLIQLHTHFLNFESPSFPSWGRKKKRSCIDVSSSSSLSPSPSPCTGSGEPKTHVNVEASSPATPLSFSPSDTDSKFYHSRIKIINKKKKAKKKTNEQLKDIVASLSNEQEQLKYEVSKLGDYYEKLRTMNLQLKARQLELDFFHERIRLDLNSCRSLEEEPAEQIDQRFSLVFRDTQALLIHQPQETPIFSAPTTVGNFVDPCVEMPLLQEAGSDRSLGSADHPYGVSGMNFLADETPIRDFHSKAAIAAQARKRRIEINRVKYSQSLKQSRLR